MKQFKIKTLGAFLLAFAVSLSSSWAQVTTYDYTGSIDNYTVPADVTSIRIETRGAQGGNDGGLGAIMIGDFDVTPGEVLTILVGQEGQINGTSQAGGGGGSFVANAADEPMIVSGGGGGIAWNGGGSPPFVGADANITTNGNDGYGSDGGSPTRYGVGGVDGNGSTIAGPGGMGHAGNGGGFYTSGAAALCGPPGMSFLAGGAGGVGCSGGSGGFGGGANGGNFGGGGGGGYSGGGGAYHAPTNGGGGGSYNDGANQDNSVGNTGHGQIIIEVLCEEMEVDVTDEVICFGESFTLNAEGEGTITWDGGVENGEPFTPDATGIITYTATSDDDGDCGFSIDIEVLELPEVTASVDEDEICLGESITCNGGGADEYEWSDGIDDDEAFEPEAGEYIYVVTGTDDAGCENTAEVEVTVHALPAVVATATDDEICLGETVTLNGEGATDYEWSAEEDGVEFTPDATGTTTYMVTGTDDNGCANTDEIDVTVYEELTITYTVVEEILGSDGEIDITVAGGNPAYDFDWDNDGLGEWGDDEDLTGLTGGTSEVMVMCEAGCEASETINVGSQVGIDELNGLAVAIYPNPAADVVTITLEGAFIYTFTSVNGAILMNGNGFNSEEISLDELANGMYMINVFADDQSSIVKLVKE
tara:strand:- start:503 stop:2446 length:1944 start_codon:yes stop_codon:yes gene_type:complete